MPEPPRRIDAPPGRSAHAVLNIIGGDGQPRGTVRITVPLADRDAPLPTLLDLRGQKRGDRGDRDADSVQLLEGASYEYEFDVSKPAALVETDHPEVFGALNHAGSRGWLRPGLRVGRMRVRVWADGAELGRFAFEVRSRTLDYVSAYRWMVRDISARLAEVVAERFASSETYFAPDPAAGARTLYQRFAHLHEIVASEELAGAFAEVRARPVVTWCGTDEWRQLSSGVRASGTVARELGRAGPRLSWSDAPAYLALDTLPMHVRERRHIETFDNPPNRWIKFVLESWRAEVSAVADAMHLAPDSASSMRGRRDATAVLARLDALLAEPLFATVGSLAPEDSSRLAGEVLGRPGYREICIAFARSRRAARITWDDDGDDTYGAGQRDVAMLYEYWAFFEVATAVERATGVPFDLAPLVDVAGVALSLRLARGREQVIAGVSTRFGAPVRVELWYNRTFSGGTASWTRTMRPDMSLCLRTVTRAGLEAPPVWLHFDAKYRHEGGRALADDVDRMHAYRDAIHHSYGAYVLHPGTIGRLWVGAGAAIGAFALHPTADTGSPSRGTPAVEAHVAEVVSSVAGEQPTPRRRPLS